MKKILLALLPFFTYQILNAQEHVIGNTTLTEREVVNGLDVPWEIKWGPDDYLWITEREAGTVSRINVENGERHVILDLSSIIYSPQYAEAGLLGMEIHPEFNNGAPYVFLAYTYGNNNPKERIVSFEYDSTNDQLINEDILIDSIDAATTHIGCRLLALDDLTMLITTGDAQQVENSQNPNFLTGKTLRISINHIDGSFGDVPLDNPIQQSYVYSIGHRNSQGLALGPNNIIYSSEHGADTDDELNIISMENNYGWPDVEGFCNYASEIEYCNNNDITEPLWSSGTQSTIAPSDIIWYDHPSIPEFQNTLLMSVLKDKKLVRFKFSDDGQTMTEEDDFFVNTWGRLRDICVSPDGKIYIATNGNSWPSQGPNEIIELSNEAYEPVAITENSISLNIYPNPIYSNGALTIDIPNSNQVVEITDLAGKLIISEKMKNQQIQLDGNLSKGTYILKVGNLNSKLIIQ
ncbi:MAG: glucose dehydrogenase [Flavobacteriales bacterium]|nr:glucose dehydrogenase [Flavobacteriales bacterium]|tara:strand:- start:3306 stop:4697 length:1392 start_codon:yes stop_codon:yes gene_type:complete